MTAIPNPCTNCPDRWAECHAGCGKYGAWRAEMNRRGAVARAGREADAVRADWAGRDRRLREARKKRRGRM